MCKPLCCCQCIYAVSGYRRLSPPCVLALMTHVLYSPDSYLFSHAPLRGCALTTALFLDSLLRPHKDCAMNMSTPKSVPGRSRSLRGARPFRPYPTGRWESPGPWKLGKRRLADPARTPTLNRKAVRNRQSRPPVTRLRS